MVSFAQPESVHYQRRNPVDSNTHTSGFSGGSPASYCFPLLSAQALVQCAPVHLLKSAPLLKAPAVTQPHWPGIRAKPPWPWLRHREARLRPERKREGEIILFWAGPAEGTAVLTRRGHPWSVHWAMRWAWYTCLLSMADSLTLNGINPQRTSLFRRD